MKLDIKNKVNNKDWLLKTSFAENEFAYKVLEDERLWDIGEWGLDYVTLKDTEEEIGYCTIAIGANIEIYGLSILQWHRRKGYCKKFMELIIEQYSKENTISIELSTRSLYLEKVLKDLGFKYSHSKISEYSNIKEERFILKAKGE